MIQGPATEQTVYLWPGYWRGTLSTIAFILVSQRGERDQDIGAACVCPSAVVLVCAHLYGWPWVYVYCMYVCPHASQWDGRRDVVLQQLSFCQATRFGDLQHRPEPYIFK